MVTVAKAVWTVPAGLAEVDCSQLLAPEAREVEVVPVAELEAVVAVVVLAEPVASLEAAAGNLQLEQAAEVLVAQLGMAPEVLVGLLAVVAAEEMLEVVDYTPPLAAEEVVVVAA